MYEIVQVHFLSPFEVIAQISILHYYIAIRVDISSEFQMYSLLAKICQYRDSNYAKDDRCQVDSVCESVCIEIKIDNAMIDLIDDWCVVINNSNIL